MHAEPPDNREQMGRRAGERTATQEEPRPLGLGDASRKRVLVTGGEGFLGSHLIPRLVARGHDVRATYIDAAGPGRRGAPGIDWRRVDLCREEELRGVAEACDVVVHLAGRFVPAAGLTLARIHGTGTRLLVAEAERAGVKRLVHVSVLGARPGDAGYFGTKFDAETAVVSSPIPSVILRPSVIYGPGDRFTSSILRMLARLPAFPLPGGGRFRLQPLAVEDMVDALSQCVERPDLDGGEFELAGPERLTFREIVTITAELSGLRRPFVTLPERIALSATGLAHRAGFPAPFTPEQIALFTTDSVLDTDRNPLLEVFLVKPLPFRDALADYLEVES
ncbi:MAG: NAD-dependent epimerase/dehydratase family protein [Gemmatimonadota bacterium]